MKKLFLIFLLLLNFNLAFSMDIEIKGIRQDTFQNEEGYWIDIEYTMPDGAKVLNPYPLLVANIAGRNLTQALYFITENIRWQVNNYLKEKYPEVKLNRKDAVTAFLNNQVGKKFTFPNEIFFEQDINYDGRVDNIVVDLNGNIKKVIIRNEAVNTDITSNIIK